MFSDVFESLCRKKGVSANRACIEMGLSRSIAAKWKSTNTGPSTEVIPKIANYFGVSIDYLLGITPEAARDNAMFELKNLRERLSKAKTDEEKEEIQNAIAFLEESLEDIVLSERLFSQKNEKPATIPDDGLSEDEIEVLKYYRQLSPAEKRISRKQLEALLDKE